jgi:multisubunit Na+/H+ antiporter MnhE subunit
MLNIFNLFLFLLALWVMFMLAAEKTSWLYMFFGILSSGLVSAASFRLKIIESKSELLYLSLGFYRHFVKIFFYNFFSASKLLLKLAFAKKLSVPLIYSVRQDSDDRFNPALLMASFNMTTGLFCIGAKDEEILIHAISEEYFKKFNLQKACKILNNINDDNLV